MADNYEISRDRAQEYFLRFDQQELARRWALELDERYLYAVLFGRRYRICRKTGMVLDPGGAQADFCQSLTLFDLLCYSNGHLAPTGRYATVNSLKGAPKSGGVAPGQYSRLAGKIAANPEKFCGICEKMGAQALPLGDLCYRFEVFDKLTVLVKFYYGDEEFVPSVTLLWEENTLEHMHYETVFYAAGCLVRQLEDALADYRLVPARPDEVGRCKAILDDGREFQRQQGFVQWPDGYPPLEMIAQDVEKGMGYVVKADGKIAAYMLLDFGGDPAYADPRCTWHDEGAYLVIHRMAIDAAFRGRGIAGEIFCLVADFARAQQVYNLRIDTDPQNKRMQHVLEKCGFRYCGLVIQGGGDRMAYDKQL